MSDIQPAWQPGDWACPEALRTRQAGRSPDQAVPGDFLPLLTATLAISAPPIWGLAGHRWRRTLITSGGHAPGKTSMRIFSLLTGMLLLASAELAPAHGGGLNAQGCHNNRKTGDYHCHRAQAPAAVRRPTANSTPQPLFRQPPSEKVTTERQTAGQSAGDVFYANCSAARAAGAAPVRRGDAGYASHLDRDNDGVGCE